MADTPNIAFSKDELDANYLTFWKSSNIALDVYLTEFLTDKVRILLFQINSQISQYSKVQSRYIFQFLYYWWLSLYRPNMKRYGVLLMMYWSSQRLFLYKVLFKYDKKYLYYMKIFRTINVYLVTERPTHHDAYYPFQMEIFRRYWVTFSFSSLLLCCFASTRASLLSHFPSLSLPSASVLIPFLSSLP